MATVQTPMEPCGMVRPKSWDDKVEEAYRFQLAGYRDEREYAHLTQANVERWPHNGYIKKLIRKDGCWYYFNKTRECSEKDVSKCKLYSYSQDK
ncbi:hypothetical protein FSP39_009882 [Pinctada imbricata]|uniref:Meiosis expressed gene 1 protein homolog n=1 Tax=Pinctada imbricata TaxID=66713 RepID=A0AA88YCC9_PINIB|nr:hypothetical protein FSP39_009882 [Pinctada imbricata]